MKRLVVRKGQKRRTEGALFVPLFEKHKEVAGRVDLEMYFIEHLEKRLFIEREVLMQFLQGKDSTHHRINAKKLGPGWLPSTYHGR